MKIIILDSPNSAEIIDRLKLKGISDVRILNKINTPMDMEPVVMGKRIVIIPEKAYDALYVITAYCDEYRSPKHGKIPLIIINDNQPYQDIIEQYLKDYRRIRPDVPSQEANSHYIVFKKTMADFFQLTNINDLSDIIESLKNKYKKSTISLPSQNPNSELPDSYHPKLKKLLEHFKNLNQYSNAIDFSNAVSKTGKSAVIIAAGEGNQWDENNRSDLYQNIGQTVVELGYSQIISGGPDGCGKKSGPMFHSAKGAAKIEGVSLSICYTAWIFENLCHPDDLIDLGVDVRNISFVSNEAVRKAFLISPADIVVALPGALGTITEILASILLNKKILLFNTWIEERNSFYYQGFYQLLQNYDLDKKIHLINVFPKMNFHEVFEAVKTAINEFEITNISKMSP